MTSEFKSVRSEMQQGFDRLGKKIDTVDKKVDDMRGGHEEYFVGIKQTLNTMPTREELPELVNQYAKDTIVPEITSAVEKGLEPYKHLLSQKSDKQAADAITSEVERSSQVAANTRRIDTMSEWITHAAPKVGVEYKQN